MNSCRRSILVCLPLLIATLIAAPSTRAQGVRCGAGQDLIVQALEQITPQSGNDAFGNALQLLKSAVAECPELGDAWYYRSLVEKRLATKLSPTTRWIRLASTAPMHLIKGLNPLVSRRPPHAESRLRVLRLRCGCPARKARPRAAEVGARRRHRPLYRHKDSPAQLHRL